MPQSVFESCPLCDSAASVRPKLLLIDEAWVERPGVDARLAYFADLRVDDLKVEAVRSEPLSQLVDGYYCSACGRGFVGDAVLKDARRHYK